MLSLKVDEIRCNGCGLCQAACALGQVMKRGFEKPYALEQLPKPLLKVQENAGKRQIAICRHCESPVCADACVAGALAADKILNTVILDRGKCVGCYSCVMECPFGAPEMDASHGKMHKCDGCNTMPVPLCASFCPTGALQATRNSHEAAARRRQKRMEHKYGSPERAAFRR